MVSFLYWEMTDIVWVILNESYKVAWVIRIFYTNMFLYISENWNWKSDPTYQDESAPQMSYRSKLSFLEIITVANSNLTVWIWSYKVSQRISYQTERWETFLCLSSVIFPPFPSASYSFNFSLVSGPIGDQNW